MKITTALLKAADSTNTDEYYDSILEMMNQYSEAYEINTPLRVAHFLSQIGHESKFKIVEENGNYSAKRMREFFGAGAGRGTTMPLKMDALRDGCARNCGRKKASTPAMQRTFSAMSTPHGSVTGMRRLAMATNIEAGA